jgi:hypothetical protein
MKSDTKAMENTAMPDPNTKSKYYESLEEEDSGDEEEEEDK